MKAEDARKLADTALAELDNALKAGRSQELARFLEMLSRFHRYSFGNVMLILSQRPDATHVAGYHTWKSLGRFVKKGEKGITIIAPMRLRLRDDAPEGEGSDERDERTVMRFRAVTVFDASQTDGDALPEPPSVRGDPADGLDRLKQLVASKAIALTYGDLPAGADGVSRGGSISLAQGLEPAKEFSVLVHELAHELLHHGEGAQRGSRTVRETEAEAVAFVVCRAAGLDTGTAASDYIQVYQGDSETLAASLDRIQRVAAEIMAGVFRPTG